MGLSLYFMHVIYTQYLRVCTHGRRCLVKRAEPYLQHDTTSKLVVLTFFAETFPISRSSDIDMERQDGGAALEGGGVVF